MFIRSERGFTLIELLVVIAIIGILSSIVLASLNSARQKGRDTKRVADLKQVQLALELHYDSNGTYPTADTGNVIPASLATDGYIAVIPKDPTDDVVYPYERLSNGTSYHLGANLEDNGNSALDSDSDANNTVITSGADTDSCTGTAGRYCYDLTP